MFKNKYRIIRDDYKGFEAQVKYWFFPFVWVEIGDKGWSSNTSCHLSEAEEVVKRHKLGKCKDDQVIKYID